MAGNDYYATLGVSRTASEAEIKKAYRKLAKENHPDARPDDKQAAERFKEIQEAYDVVGDAEKRKQYDQMGHDFFRASRGAGGGGSGGQNPFYGAGGGRGPWSYSSGGGGEAPDLEDILGGFGFGGFGGGGGRSRTRKTTPRDVEAQVQVPFKDAILGGKLDLQLEGQSEVLSVSIPPGVEDGNKIRLKGQAPSGGDLLLNVEVLSHPWFRREGRDISVDLPLTPAEAVLGTKVDVPTLGEGMVTMTVPAGTTSGKKLRLRGKGVPASKTKEAGDQYVIIKLMIPKDSAPDAKALYEQLKGIEKFDPRAGLWS